MKPNSRNLIGTLALIVGLTLYAGLVGLLAETIGTMPLLIEALYYLFFGLVWLWPARLLLRWMAAGQELE